MGFPGSSAGKESACNAGDPGSIPGWERSPGEGLGYPLQYSWASLVAQTVKNPPAMWETWVWSLGWEDGLEKGTYIYSSVLVWKLPWTEEPGRLQSIGLQKVGHDWVTFTYNWYTKKKKKIPHFSAHFPELCFILLHWYFVCFFFFPLTNCRTIADFPDGLVVKGPCFQCRGCRFNPWSGN